MVLVMKGKWSICLGTRLKSFVYSFRSHERVTFLGYDVNFDWRYFNRYLDLAYENGVRRFVSKNTFKISQFY